MTYAAKLDSSHYRSYSWFFPYIPYRDMTFAATVYYSVLQWPNEGYSYFLLHKLREYKEYPNLPLQAIRYAIAMSYLYMRRLWQCKISASESFLKAVVGLRTCQFI